MTMKRLRSIFSGRVLAAIQAALTVLLLAPVPVLAFTWVDTSWKRISFVATQAIVKPTFTSHDGGPSVLDVNMGQASGTGMYAGASIELTRQLRIRGESERILVTSQFKSLLLNAHMDVAVWFEPLLAGYSADRLASISFSKTSRPQSIFSMSESKHALLVKGGPINNGNWVAHVKIIYRTLGTKNVTNRYNNSSPNVASPHRFTFTSG